MNNFTVRTASALVLIFAIGIIYFFFQTNGIVGVILGFIAISAMEASRMLLPQGTALILRPLYFLCVAMSVYAGIQPTYQLGFIFIGTMLCFITISILVSSLFKNIQDILKFIAAGLLSAVYLGLFPATIFKILNHPQGLVWFFALLSIVFGGDIMAYLVGSRWGKHKIMPLISPKKSLEGALGGFLGAIIAASIFSFYFLHNDTLTMIGISLLISLVAQVGDLFESLLKRIAGIKDSGSILPGHGGILDRIDGVLFAAPVMWLTIIAFNL